MLCRPPTMAGESCREEEEKCRRLVNKQNVFNRQKPKPERPPSALWVCRREPPDACWHRQVSSLFAVNTRMKKSTFFFVSQRWSELLRLTHRVGGYSQTLLDQPLKGGLQHHMLIGDGLLHDFLSWDWLQRLNNTANCSIWCVRWPCLTLVVIFRGGYSSYGETVILRN